MRSILIVLTVLTLLAAQTAAQPGPPRPPGPGPGSDSGSQAPRGTPQYVVGTVDYISSMKLTVKQQPANSNAPATSMDFTIDDKSRVAPGLKYQERVVVVYEVAGGTNLYRAVLALRCPQGTNPEDLIKQAR